MKVNIGRYPKNSQRTAKVKIEGYDTWNLDRTLAHIILPALLQYRACHHGIPNEFSDDSGNDDVNPQQSFDFYQDTHKEAFDKGVERWEETLDKMIWSFYQIIVDEGDSRYHHGTPVYKSVAAGGFHNPVTGKDEQYYNMVDTNPGEHWHDLEGHRKYEERIQEGLELFGKYYRSLWD